MCRVRVPGLSANWLIRAESSNKIVVGLGGTVVDSGDVVAASGASREVQMFADEFGILVTGSSEVAAMAIDRLLDGREPAPGTRLPMSVADGAAVVASAEAMTAEAGEYLRFAGNSADLIKQFGEQYDSTGALRGWVKDGNQFAGQLTFDKVTLAPQQALAMQSAAVSMALRTAIANVEAAVERVEGKVDEINRRLDSRLRGDVIGTLRHLEQVVASTNARGRLLQADWNAVAPIRNQLERDLTTLRTHVIRSAEALSDRSLPKREDALKDFTGRRGDVSDMLQLIKVTEQSLHLWEYLRIQEVAAREPEHVASAVHDARQSLRNQQELDVALLETLRGAVDEARVIAPLEYRHLFTKKSLTKGAASFDDVLVEFAVSTRLPELDALAELDSPTFSDARQEVGRRAGVAAKTAKSLGAAGWQTGRQTAGRGRDRVSGVLRRSRGAEEPTIADPVDGEGGAPKESEGTE